MIKDVLPLSFSLFIAVTGAAGQDTEAILRLQSDVSYLCGSELAGRDVPGPYGDMSALWLAEQLHQIGLWPAFGDTSYMQRVPLTTALLDTAQTSLKITGVSGSTDELRWGNGFYVFPRRLAAVDLTSEIAVCGYGISAEELGRDDFSVAAGRAALVLPGSGDIPVKKAGRHALVPFKAAAAERAGAAMLIVAYPPGSGKGWPPTGLTEEISRASRRLVDLPKPEPDFPIVYLDGSNLQSVLQPPDNLQSEVTVHLKVAFTSDSMTSGYNVVGRFDGSVPEYVIVGAHYDHLGVTVEGNKGEGYYPGADDNASGVAGLLEVCRRWAERENRPRRGLIAALFTAEEDGQLGSKWLVGNLPVPREAVAAMINLDMIGRDGFANTSEVTRPDAIPEPGYAAAYFSAASPQLRDILRGTADMVELNVDIRPVNSFSHFGDAAPFHRAGVPAVHLFSGFHRDYHSPDDTPDRLNFAKLTRMVELTDRLLVNLAEEPGTIGFDPGIRFEGSVVPH